MARRDAGFTLVEMLVALSLLALAAALMATGFAASQDLWRRVEGAGRRGEQVEAAQTLLRDRLERLRPATRFDGLRPYADVDGAADRVSFTALPLDAERPAPMRRYELRRNGSGDLVLSSTSRLSGGETSEAGAREQVLLRDVEALQIGYFGPDAPGAPSRWQDEWPRRQTPPELIRIRLSFAAADRRVWPDLIVRPAATVDSLCTIDPDSNTCRGRS